MSAKDLYNLEQRLSQILNEPNAVQTLKKHQDALDTKLREWNTNEKNQSKIEQLRIELEQLKDKTVENHE